MSGYPENLDQSSERPDVVIRWYQVAEWLELERNRYQFKPVSEYLVRQFLEFLNGRNMTMGQVTWELSGGVRALRALSDMLYEAAHACGVPAQPFGRRSDLGVYLDKNNYWIGIEYDQPESLTFYTYNRKVDKERGEALGVGTVYEWPDHKGYGWKRSLNLESEDVHFFARSNASQLQLLEQFLRECLESVKQIELRGGELRSDDAKEPDSSRVEPFDPGSDA